MDYDKQEFDDDEYDKEEENDDDEDYDDHYAEMDENKLADILQQPNEHQEAHQHKDHEHPQNKEH